MCVTMLAAMVGDVNLFLSIDDETGSKSAEIEVMVAEPAARRSGIATEAVQLMMGYGMHS